MEVSALVGLLFSASICLPFQILPCDLSSQMSIRKVTDFQFLQLSPCCADGSDDFQAPYMPDQKLEVGFHSFCVLPPSFPLSLHPFLPSSLSCPLGSFVLCMPRPLHIGQGFAKVAAG